MEWLITNEHHGMLIREYLQEVHGFSKRLLIAIKFDSGQIHVNGIEQRVRFVLSAGDKLKIGFPREVRGNHMNPEDILLSIVYEDADIIIINKPPNIATIPSPLSPSGTIANGLLAYYDELNIPYTVHIVTRLDRNTSGLLLVAKHRYSHSLLSRSQIAGEIKRKYKAVIEGHLVNSKGIIDAPIGRKEGSIIERTVTNTGKQAITYYEVITESPSHTLVDVELETGRTHQIRVHFAHIGHALAGDDLYGGATNMIERQALHCDEISFPHPLTKEILSFKLQIPEDMACLV